MTPLEVLLQLGTVFLGAFLAFWLENLRERRQLRGWANDYLRRVREDLIAKQKEGIVPFEEAVGRYEAFLALDENHVPSGDDWSMLLNVLYNLAGDHRALLDSPAARTLPAELVTSLAKLDDQRRAEETVAGLAISAWQEYAVRLALRQTPLTASERRGLEYVQELFRLRLGYVKNRSEAETQVLGLLDKHNLGR